MQYVELEYGQKYEYHAVDNGYNSLYMYWATDLLPEEIDENIKHVIDMGDEAIEPEINFIGMVAADMLVISPSSFSYIAGLLSERDCVL